MTLSLLLFIFACGSAPSPQPALTDQSKITEGPMEISVEDFHQQWDPSNSIVIDVRTIGEFNEGHIPKARHIPLADLPKELHSISNVKDSEIFLVCAVGGRSGQAQAIMLAEGFTKTINVDGGTMKWAAKGYPMER